MSGTARRARNPRRVALETLRSVASGLRVMIGVWDQSQTTHERAPDTDYIRYESRKLRPDERRENQAHQWDRLARWCGNSARALMDLGEAAERMAARVRAGERW